MLDFRIIIAAIIVCVSLVMTGARLLNTSDSFNATIGLRPGIVTMSELPRPSIAAKPIMPAIAEPRTPAIASKPPAAVKQSPAVAATPAALFENQPPPIAANPAPAGAAHAVTATRLPATGPTVARAGTIAPEPAGPATKSAGPPTTAAAPSPPVRQTRTANPPAADLEITGSIPLHPEAEPNVEPDWKQKLRPRRSVVANPAPPPPRQEDVAPPRPADEAVSVLEFFYRNSVAK